MMKWWTKWLNSRIRVHRVEEGRGRQRLRGLGLSGNHSDRMIAICLKKCCRCLPCDHCSNWTWVVEEILAYGDRLRSTHCREFHYMKLCRPAYFVRTTPEINTNNRYGFLNSWCFEDVVQQLRSQKQMFAPLDMAAYWGQSKGDYGSKQHCWNIAFRIVY